MPSARMIRFANGMIRMMEAMELGMRPPASPSCRLSLRAGSHRGLAYAPAGMRKRKSEMRRFLEDSKG